MGCCASSEDEQKEPVEVERGAYQAMVDDDNVRPARGAAKMSKPMPVKSGAAHGGRAAPAAANRRHDPTGQSESMPTALTGSYRSEATMRRAAMEEERRRRVVERLDEELLDVNTSAMETMLEDAADPAAVAFCQVLRAVKVPTGSDGIFIGPGIGTDNTADSVDIERFNRGIGDDVCMDVAETLHEAVIRGLEKGQGGEVEEEDVFRSGKDSESHRPSGASTLTRHSAVARFTPPVSRPSQ